MSPTIMIAIVLVQVVCLELRGPGCLSMGASNAGPCVGTSKDQHQVNTNYEDDEEGQVSGDKEDQQKGDKDESDNFLSRQSLTCRGCGAWQRCKWAFELINTF